MIAVKFFLLIISVLLGYTLGFILTETKYRLAQYPLFQFQAFECRKCLSTHIAWVTSTFISLLFNDWIMFTIGLFFAAMLFIGLYIDQKNKTVRIEDYDDFEPHDIPIDIDDEPMEIEIKDGEIIINKKNDK